MSLSLSYDISSNDIQVRVIGFDVFQHIMLINGVSLRRINDNRIDSSSNEMLESFLVSGPKILSER
jgi:hypothetical protein